MKKIFSFLSAGVLLLSLGSCGGHTSNDPNLTPLQNQAVALVKSHLERGDKMVEYKVVEEPMPVSLMEQPFLNLRNTVYKLGLDYQSCKTRGIQAGMEMAENKIEEARQQIIATQDMLKKNVGNANSVIVLAKIKSRKSQSGEPYSLVVVFDAETLEQKEWIPVTTPVQNSVALVLCADDNTLAEYAKEQNHNTQILANKVSDPVVKFVLEAKPL